VFRNRKQDAVFSKNGIHSLMLAFDGDAVQLEPNMVSLGGAPAKRGVETKSNLGLSYNMNIAFIPTSLRGVDLLDKDSIT